MESTLYFQLEQGNEPIKKGAIKDGGISKRVGNVIAIVGHSETATRGPRLWVQCPCTQMVTVELFTS